MALYKITVVRPTGIGRNRLEVGMSVELSCLGMPSVMGGDRERIIQLFRNKYGVDFPDHGYVHPYVKIEKQ